MKKITNILVLLIIVALSSTISWGQNLLNGQAVAGAKIINTGTIKVKGNLYQYGNGVAGSLTNTSGIIEFTSTDSKLVSAINTPISGGFVVNTSGTFKFSGITTDAVFTTTGGTALGFSNTERITGTVEYAAGSGSQNVSGADVGNTGAATYYTNLTMSGGGSKIIDDKNYVSAVYTASGGNRTYTGTFYYDGSSDQNIFGENEDVSGYNLYDKLDFSGGATNTTGTKTIVGTATTDAVKAKGTLTTAAGTATMVHNSFVIGQSSTGTSTINGNFTIAKGTQNAEFKPGQTDVTFASTSTLDLNTGGAGGTGSRLTIDKVGQVNIATANATVTQGIIDLTNAATDSTRLNIVTGGSLSLVNSADAILQLDGSKSRMTVTGTYTDNLVAATNQTFNAGSQVFYNGAAGQTIQKTVAANPYGTLITTGNKTAGGDIYYAGNLGVAGGNLDMGSNTLFMTDVKNKNNFYNAAAPDQPVASLDGTAEVIGKMQLAGGANFETSKPYRLNNHRDNVTFTTATTPFASGHFFQLESHPGTAPTNYIVTSDVNRKQLMSFSTGVNWTYTMEVGYMTSEISGMTQPEAKLKDFEVNGATFTKMATGSQYTYQTAAQPHSVSLAGFKTSDTAMLSNADELFANGNQLLLRSSSIMYSIRNGRWSNPATWDDGVEPPSDADVHIRHNVHVGYVRATDDYGVGHNGGHDETTPNDMAAKVTIGESGNATMNPVAALLIGTGAKTSYNLVTSPTVLIPGTLTNYGTGSANTADLSGASIDAGGSTIYSGFLVAKQVTGYTIPSIFTNEGLFGNAGAVFVGQ